MVSNVDFNVNLDTVLSIYATPSINLVINPNDNELHSDTLSVDVSTNNPTGYALTMGTENTSLVNSTVSSATIPTLASSTTATNFPTNYWGISTDNGNNFMPMPATFSFTPTTGPNNHSITNLILGAKANTEKPAGTYTGVITFSATANIEPAKNIYFSVIDRSSVLHPITYQYQAEEGMTWTEFIKSPYNIDEFYEGTNCGMASICIKAYGSALKSDKSTHTVQPEETLIPNYEYTVGGIDR